MIFLWTQGVKGLTHEEQTMHKKKKFSIKDFFSKFDKVRKKLRIWSHLQKKHLMENLCNERRTLHPVKHITFLTIDSTHFIG